MGDQRKKYTHQPAAAARSRTVSLPEEGTALGHQLRALLVFHQAMGLRFYPATPGLRHFLGARSTHRQGTPTSRQKGGDSRPPADGEARLTVLRKTIARCDRCPLAATPSGRCVGQGKSGSRLMVVGDRSRAQKSGKGSGIFGMVEDELFWKMMAAIGQGPERIYVTTSLKCPVRSDMACQALPTACCSHLEHEIQAVGPLVICAMGELAAHWLTGHQRPLIRGRGVFQPCRFNKDIAVMPTLPPSLLLRHPEMKRSAWHDLLKIQKKLTK